jgi:microcin C transport system substrate-binding protein
MMVMSYPQSQSPGNELMSMFHSTSAHSKGAYNVGGISDPDIDILLETIIYSSERGEMIVASNLLDRLLWNEFYMLPNWYINTHRIAFFDKFNQPKELPRYYEATNYILKTWSIR